MRCCIERLALLPLLVTVLVSCEKPPAPPPAPKDLRIHLTCDVSGRIEPCGCFEGQGGGLSRVKSVFAAEKLESLRVDAGDAITGAEDYQVIHYRHVRRAFAESGFHALNLGKREAALSAETLRSLIADSPVPMLSANVADAATQQPLARPWLHVQAGGVSYGVIGIVDPRSVGETKLGAGLTLLDPASVISQHLPALKKGADVLVLLAFADEATMQALAARFFEFAVILGGDVRQPSQELMKANRSYIFATTNQSRALGLFEARLTARGALEGAKQEILTMHELIPENKTILQHAQDYRDEVRAAKLAIDDPLRVRKDAVPGVRMQSAFRGSESCAACHAAEYAIWQRSGHARAFEALKLRDSDADPNCIGCHTVGFGAESGYQRAFQGKQLANVGCESCHGAGGRHVDERLKGNDAITFHFRKLSASDCTKCHHGEFSRPFEWDDFWPPVAHQNRK